MVKYFSQQMHEIIGASVDLLFCNEEEAMIHTGTGSLAEAREKLKDAARHFVITLGANGAMIYDGLLVLALWLLTLLPLGTLQLIAAIDQGYWYARSAEFMQQPLVDLLVWMRVPGDTIFSVGALLQVNCGSVLGAYGDTLLRIVEEPDEAVAEGHDAENALIRSRAEALAARHPELRDQLRQFAADQAAETAFLEQNMVSAVWVLQRQ